MKFFDHLVARHSSFFSDPCADTQFQGEPLQRGRRIHGRWEKLAIFIGNRRLTRKRCEIGRWLIRNVNRKVTDAGSNGIIFDDLSDPKPGFQGHCILRSRISQKRCNVGTNLLKNTNIWNHIGLRRMVPLDLEWPLTPISRSRRFSTLNISETTRDRAIVTIERQ